MRELGCWVVLIQNPRLPVKDVGRQNFNPLTDSVKVFFVSCFFLSSGRWGKIKL